jgi:peptidoglycan hydrolase-like protein with peptidoglycan-binding domain
MRRACVIIVLCLAWLLSVITPGQASILQYGARSATVATWQHNLNLTGVYPRIAEDGVFGPETHYATEYFQYRVGLRETGIVDSITAGMMSSWLGPLNPTIAKHLVGLSNLRSMDRGMLKVALSHTHIPWDGIFNRPVQLGYIDSTENIGAMGGRYGTNYVIWINSTTPYLVASALAHEVGHIFDASYLTQNKRDCIESVVPGSWWDAPYDYRVGEAFAQLFINLYTDTQDWKDYHEGAISWNLFQQSAVRWCVEQLR